MIGLDQALACYAQTLQALPAETAALDGSVGRVLAEPLRAPVDLPRFDQSAMDGYALAAADTRGASGEQPAALQLVGESAAGIAPLAAVAVATGQCWRISTGARLPPGTDAVVAQERVRREADRIWLSQPVNRGRNVRHQGEECRAGDPLAAAGSRLSPGLIAALALAGHAQARLYRRPRVAVLITGNEVMQAGAALPAGATADANGPLIRAWLQARGLPLASLRHLPDERASIEAALGEAFAQADVVVSTGGASVGDHDHLPAASRALGGERVFWQVAQKPGKPLLYALHQGRPLLAFPGNPAAVLVGLSLHLASVLAVLEGAREPGLSWREGRLVQPVAGDGERARLLRARREDRADGTRLQVLAHQESHMLSNLAAADSLVWLPPRAGDYGPGDTLRWLALDR
ncbi:MAG TPA: molybdopterin molybdotransferase MoeA [Nevskiaceae bacterium]|nr:molybdopterin molybdotransferase MoeA [Nevskiaceae bacterium]